MTALVGDEVSRTLDLSAGPSGVTGEFRGRVASQPHQARDKDDADLVQTRREMSGVGS